MSVQASRIHEALDVAAKVHEAIRAASGDASTVYRADTLADAASAAHRLFDGLRGDYEQLINNNQRGTE